MPFFLAYILISVLLIGNTYFNLSPTLIWLLCYIIIICTLPKKSPLDPRIWLFTAWCIVLCNHLCGIKFKPNIDYFEPISYICIIIASFHLGYWYNNDVTKRRNKYKIKRFLSTQLPPKLQLIITLLGICSFIGLVFIIYDLFYNLNMSTHGGDRRGEFIENIDKLSFLTKIGTIMIGGCYFSIISIFFQGNRINKFVGCLSIIALGGHSIAIGGKQGIFQIVLIFIFIIFTYKEYSLKIKIPKYTICLITIIISILTLYITRLSSERHGNAQKGELLTKSTEFTESFKEESAYILPESFQNTFAEFFGYYGDQIGAFSERWAIENYPEKYELIEFPPKILDVFVWLKRQIVKVFPIYDDIFPTKEKGLGHRISVQNKGYYSLAYWQTSIKAGLDQFGFIGLIITVFLHGYLSKRLCIKFNDNPRFSYFHYIILNNMFVVYTTMMPVIGETSIFFYLITIAIFSCLEYFKGTKYPYI